MIWLELSKIPPPYCALALVFVTWRKQHKDASDRPTDEQNADRKKKGNQFIAERATLLTERSKSIGISPWGELDKT